MAKRLRLKKMVNWRVQGPIVTRLIVHVVSYNAVILCLLLVIWGVRASLSAVIELPESTGPLTFWQQSMPVVICVLLMIPYMVWDLMKLTNRIAGPLFRFETLMNDFVRSGTLRQAVIRDGDLLTDFQLQFNEFTMALHALYPETKPVPSAGESAIVSGHSKAVVPARVSV